MEADYILFYDDHLDIKNYGNPFVNLVWAVFGFNLILSWILPSSVLSDLKVHAIVIIERSFLFQKNIKVSRTFILKNTARTINHCLIGKFK